MELIRDDPIVRSMELTGYPPWMQKLPPDYEDDEWEEDADVYYGSETSSF